jgi:hypothetical protein
MQKMPGFVTVKILKESRSIICRVNELIIDFHEITSLVKYKHSWYSVLA